MFEAKEKKSLREQKKWKKTGNHKEFSWKENTNLLEMQCCKIIWEERKDKKKEKKVYILG